MEQRFADPGGIYLEQIHRRHRRSVALEWCTVSGCLQSPRGPRRGGIRYPAALCCELCVLDPVWAAWAIFQGHSAGKGCCGWMEFLGDHGVPGWAADP